MQTIFLKGTHCFTGLSFYSQQCIGRSFAGPWREREGVEPVDTTKTGHANRHDDDDNKVARTHQLGRSSCSSAMQPSIFHLSSFSPGESPPTMRAAVAIRYVLKTEAGSTPPIRRP